MKYAVYTLFLLLSACGQQGTVYCSGLKLPAVPNLLIAGQSNAVSPAQGDISTYKGNSASVAWLMLQELQPLSFTNIAIGNTSTRQWREVHFERLLTAKLESHFDAVLWVQGESDYLVLTEGETYDNMRTMILSSGLPWIIAMDGVKVDSATRFAQQRLINECIAYEGPDIDAMRVSHSEWFESGIEFTNEAGIREHAKAWDVVLKRYK